MLPGKEKDMFEIKGKLNTAICYATVVEDGAIEQIRRMCDYELTEDSKVRIMPDDYWNDYDDYR